MGYCPFFSLGHDTTDCIVTQQGTSTHDQQRAMTRPATHHDTTNKGPRHGRPVRRGECRMRARPFLSGVAIQSFVSLQGATFGSRYNAHQRCDMTTCPHDTACDTVSESCDTVRSARGMGLLLHDTIFVSRQGSCDTALQRSRARGETAGGACDTDRGGPRHGAQCATTRRYARGMSAVLVQREPSLGLGCAHCAPNPVLTQFTVYSHC